MKEIKGFNGEYRFLSNFYEEYVYYEEAMYPTNEHAFQAAKFYVIDLNTRNKVRSDILTLDTPGKAKRWGRKVQLRSDWEETKYGIMYDIVLAKFSQNVYLKNKLLATEDAYLEETNYWNDTTWGVCKGVGKNWLGQILMDVRRQLK